MKIKTGSLFVLLMIVITSVAAQQDDSGEPVVTDTNDVVEVQEVKYVTDKLRLSLYKQADSNSGVMKLLISGDELDVLEKTGPYSKVRTTEGLIGWVKNGFLVSIKTANLLLEEEISKNRQLQKQIDKYADTEKLVQDYEQSLSKMDADLQSLKQELDTSVANNEELSAANESLSAQLNSKEENEKPGVDEVIVLTIQYWYVVAAALGFIFIIGLLIGRSLVEAQVKRRFQGVKVW